MYQLKLKKFTDPLKIDAQQLFGLVAVCVLLPQGSSPNYFVKVPKVPKDLINVSFLKFILIKRFVDLLHNANKSYFILAHCYHLGT